MPRIHSLSVRIDGRDILHNIAFDSAGAGKVTALIGPNGSGKSTLLKALAGLVSWQGSVQQSDGSPYPAASHCVHDFIGYLPQDCASSSRLSALETVILGANGRLGWRVPEPILFEAAALLAEMGLQDQANRSLATLSGGQRQMVFLAQVLMRQPRLLLLDEPVSALDLRHQRHVLELINDITRRRNLHTVIVLHDMNAALRHASHAVLLTAGRVLASGPSAKVLTPPQLSQAFATPIRQLSDDQGIPVLYPGY